MSNSVRRHVLLVAVVLGVTGCVMDAEEEVGRSAFAVAEQMAADGIDPGAVAEVGPDVACVCGSGISSACEYMYYPAAEVCFTSSEHYADVSATEGTVRNDSITYNRTVYCAFGTIFYYLDFYDPPHLYDVAVYARKPVDGTEDITIDMRAATMTDDAWDLQDNCDLASAGSNSPQQTRCYTEPLDAGQVLVSFEIDLPEIDVYGDYYIQGFRLCFDPDGWE